MNSKLRRKDVKNVQVHNLDKDRQLVRQGSAADGAWTRLRGLLGRRSLLAGEGLMIVPCKSIHTCFMQFPIDILYVNKQHVVIDIDHAIPPWRFGRYHAAAHFVVELPAGTAIATLTQIGDQLRIDGYTFRIPVFERLRRK